MATLLRRAARDLEALPGPLAAKAREIIARLDDEPSLGKKLVGPLSGQRSARLGRSHRIIYTAVDGELFVMTVVARKDAYR